MPARFGMSRTSGILRLEIKRLWVELGQKDDERFFTWAPFYKAQYPHK
ncbi:MAG: hypothetical protein JWQ14_635 [Adhaeribacter sp.]|nr:hypothetical protein [Adhaeribacter sp.]